MVTVLASFEVQTECLNIFRTSFGLKGFSRYFRRNTKIVYDYLTTTLITSKLIRMQYLWSTIFNISQRIFNSLNAVLASPFK
jgi:hypothetical protein